MIPVVIELPRPDYAETQEVGLFALLPAVVDFVRVPVVATGGMADARGVAAALVLGASAAQIGTAFLRCPETKIHPGWAKALAETAPKDTVVSRVFSGRAGRSIATDYVRAWTFQDAPSARALLSLSLATRNLAPPLRKRGCRDEFNCSLVPDFLGRILQIDIHTTKALAAGRTPVMRRLIMRRSKQLP